MPSKRVCIISITFSIVQCNVPECFIYFISEIVTVGILKYKLASVIYLWTLQCNQRVGWGKREKNRGRERKSEGEERREGERRRRGRKKDRERKGIIWIKKKRHWKTSRGSESTSVFVRNHGTWLFVSGVFYYHMALILHLGLLFYEIFPTDDVNYNFCPGRQFTDSWNKTKWNNQKKNNLCGLRSDKIIAVWYTSKINNSTND